MRARMAACSPRLVAATRSQSMAPRGTSGAGPGVLSRLAIEPDVHDGRLVIVPTREIALERQIRVVWT